MIQQLGMVELLHRWNILRKIRNDASTEKRETGAIQLVKVRPMDWYHPSFLLDSPYKGTVQQKMRGPKMVSINRSHFN